MTSIVSTLKAASVGSRDVVIQYSAHEKIPCLLLRDQLSLRLNKANSKLDQYILLKILR